MKRIGILLILTIAAYAVITHSQTKPTGRIIMEAAFVQKDAPVNLESVNHSIEFLYNRAEVKNVSDRTIQAVTFGVLLHDGNSASRAPVLVASRMIQTNIKAGEVRSVDVLAFPREEAQTKVAELKSNKVAAEFGVLAVQFADGGTWEFDWHPGGAFAFHGGISGPISLNN